MTKQPLAVTRGRAAGAASLFEAGRDAYNMARSFWREHLTFTVAVSEDDRIYPDVHRWLLEVMPDRQHRALVVHTGAGRYEDMAVPSGEDPARAANELRLSYSDRHARTVDIDGHRVQVHIEGDEESGKITRPAPKRIEFRSYSQAGQRAVIAHLKRIHEERSKTKPVLRIVNQWGNWDQRSDLPMRDLRSVILPDQQLNGIVDDLRDFLAAEDRYNRLAIPWHRGYMFHGPPGTGKTSLVKALASEFALDLWYISLSDLTAESSLMGLLSSVRPRSMLLLEDIDTVRITQDRDAGTQGQISLSSLLNALDGVATPHGLITVMTTNHFEKLDPALTRAGRMDRVEELTYPGPLELRRLYRHYFSRDLTGPLAAGAITQAEASELFKRHLDDPHAAATALFDACGTRRQTVS